jgi:hypothetical protein
MIRAAKAFPVPAEPGTRAEAANARRRDDREFAKHMRANQKPARKADGTPSPDAQPQAEQADQPTLIQVVAQWLDRAHETSNAIGGIAKLAAKTDAAVATPDDTTLAAPDVAKPTLTIATPKPELPLTPLEQAVHDLLDHAERDGATDADVEAPLPITTPLAAAPTAELEHAPDVPAPQPIAPPAPIAQPAEQAITHYTHLVLDDGSGVQVSMRIAVRGSTVNVALKSNDDATTAALARNAGSLDEAIRGRGLDMNNFTAERDSDRSERNRERREREQQPEERFQLEENK